MTGFCFAIPGDLNLPTGGYGYDRRVMAECRAAGIPVRHLPLPASFPNPSVSDLQASGDLLQSVPPGEPILIDGLALGAMPLALLSSVEHPLAALVHHPLALETGLAAGDADRLRASETAALSRARAVITTSLATAQALANAYGVAPGLIMVAEPGTDAARQSPLDGNPPIILTVGSVIARKGYGTLVQALALLGDLDWRCHVVGALDRDRAETNRIMMLIKAHSLGERIVLCGSLETDALEAEYARADLFVLASHYEGYGMVVDEARAHGLPVIGTRTGVLAGERRLDGVQTIEPADAAALAATLRPLLADSAARKKLGGDSWRAAQVLTRWPATARIIANVMQGIGR